jgi:putative RNA 2'-phosphotransferase
MSAIRRCEEHGFFAAETCPLCDVADEHILSSERQTRLSKFMSGALRHFPDDVGVKLDDRGWTEYDALVETVTNRYSWTEPDHIAAVIETDPKGRFERDSGRVRAAYGHSIDVALEATDTPVPDRLYHGTTPANQTAISREGLRPKNRQAVHLSETPTEAREVGRRHASEPIVLEIDTRRMVENGRRIMKRGRGVYTTEAVPPEYITEHGANEDETENGTRCRGTNASEHLENRP